MHPVLKVAAVITALVIGFFANDLRQLASPSSNETIALENYCFVSTKPCEQDTVTMTLDTDNAQPLIPATITVNWEGAQSETLMLVLKGVEMDMGTVKYVLKPVQGNQFQAEIILPICTSHEMTWIGTLTDGQQTVFPAIRIER
ncbi:hypothetical protein AB6E04_14015 [Vibrio amylolyticus]|uniref:hypothetical protein n=1 Tax=Vibrio amylolyticus TaxID=2847292 RepID=UPI00354D7F32